MNPLDKVIIAVGALLVAFIAGMGIMRAHDDTNIATIKANYNAQVNAAVNAKAAAEQRATNTEHTQAAAITAAVTHNKEVQDAQHEKDQAVIAALRNGSQRLSVRTNRPAASCPLPGVTASAAGPDAAGAETLAEPVAARLAGRYADYNRIVDKLTECQAVIAADRLPPAP